MSQDRKTMISVTQLTKRFKEFTAVNQLSFEMQPGDIVGFLGPNGAGKSTTMKMLTGFLAPSSGEIKIDGLELAKHSKAIQAKIGYLPEGAPSYGDMTVIQFLNFVAKIRNVDSKFRHQRIADVVQQLALEKVLNKPIENLSKGFKRRVGLAQAIVHDPQILILDEPTTGLDPNQLIEIRQLIKNVGKEKTVLLSTHIMQEVDAICDRVLMLRQGKLVLDAHLAQLRQSRTLQLRTNADIDALPDYKPDVIFVTVKANVLPLIASAVYHRADWTSERPRRRFDELFAFPCWFPD